MPFVIGYIRYHNYYIPTLYLKGKVENIVVDIKETMEITVSNKKHNIMHDWPKFQKSVVIGDSVYKEKGKYDILLVKQDTKERIICHYKEE